MVDYFVETSTPIASEDPPLCDPSDTLVLTTQAVNGTIVRNPAQSSYSCGDVVTLTAQPDAGATFVGWSGALSGTANPASVTINADTTVTANFVLDTTAPQVSNVNVTAGNTSAVLSWQTNELSVGAVEYGLTTSYELGSVASTHAIDSARGDAAQSARRRESITTASRRRTASATVQPALTPRSRPRRAEVARVAAPGRAVPAAPVAARIPPRFCPTTSTRAFSTAERGRSSTRRETARSSWWAPGHRTRSFCCRCLREPHTTRGATTRRFG